MKNELSIEELAQYQRDGFLVKEGFLSPDELGFWREALDEAVVKRNGSKLPDREEVYGKGDNDDKFYFDNVFDQLINLWQDNEKMKKIMLDERLGQMAAQLAGVDGIRIWHDQALIKKPWANPTSWHLDTPYCFSSPVLTDGQPSRTRASAKIWGPFLPPTRNSKPAGP
jgi:hypothetical protein